MISRVIKIQRVFRGMLGRRRAARAYHALCNRKANVIQGMYRKWFARREINILRIERLMFYAIMIQSLYRGIAGRKKFADLRLKFRNEKARVVQRYYRGYCGRCRYVGLKLRMRCILESGLHYSARLVAMVRKRQLDLQKQLNAEFFKKQQANRVASSANSKLKSTKSDSADTKSGVRPANSFQDVADEANPPLGREIMLLDSGMYSSDWQMLHMSLCYLCINKPLIAYDICLQLLHRVNRKREVLEEQQYGNVGASGAGIGPKPNFSKQINRVIMLQVYATYVFKCILLFMWSSVGPARMIREDFVELTLYIIYHQQQEEQRLLERVHHLKAEREKEERESTLKSAKTSLYAERVHGDVGVASGSDAKPFSSSKDIKTNGAVADARGPRSDNEVPPMPPLSVNQRLIVYPSVYATTSINSTLVAAVPHHTEPEPPPPPETARTERTEGSELGTDSVTSASPSIASLDTTSLDDATMVSSLASEGPSENSHFKHHKRHGHHHHRGAGSARGSKSSKNLFGAFDSFVHYSVSERRKWDEADNAVMDDEEEHDLEHIIAVTHEASANASYIQFNNNSLAKTAMPKRFKLRTRKPGKAKPARSHHYDIIVELKRIKREKEEAALRELLKKNDTKVGADKDNEAKLPAVHLNTTLIYNQKGKKIRGINKFQDVNKHLCHSLNRNSLNFNFFEEMEYMYFVNTFRRDGYSSRTLSLLSFSIMLRFPASSFGTDLVVPKNFMFAHDYLYNDTMKAFEKAKIEKRKALKATANASSNSLKSELTPKRNANYTSRFAEDSSRLMGLAASGFSASSSVRAVASGLTPLMESDGFKRVPTPVSADGEGGARQPIAPVTTKPEATRVPVMPLCVLMADTAYSTTKAVEKGCSRVKRLLKAAKAKMTALSMEEQMMRLEVVDNVFIKAHRVIAVQKIQVPYNVIKSLVLYELIPMFKHTLTTEQFQGMLNFVENKTKFVGKWDDSEIKVSGKYTLLERWFAVEIVVVQCGDMVIVTKRTPGMVIVNKEALLAPSKNNAAQNAISGRVTPTVGKLDELPEEGSVAGINDSLSVSASRPSSADDSVTNRGHSPASVSKRKYWDDMFSKVIAEKINESVEILPLVLMSKDVNRLNTRLKMKIMHEIAVLHLANQKKLENEVEMESKTAPAGSKSSAESQANIKTTRNGSVVGTSLDASDMESIQLEKKLDEQLRNPWLLLSSHLLSNVCLIVQPHNAFSGGSHTYSANPSAFGSSAARSSDSTSKPAANAPFRGAKSILLVSGQSPIPAAKVGGAGYSSTSSMNESINASIQAAASAVEAAKHPRLGDARRARRAAKMEELQKNPESYLYTKPHNECRLVRVVVPDILHYRTERNDMRLESYSAQLIQQTYRGFIGRSLCRRLTQRMYNQIRQTNTLRNRAQHMAKIRKARLKLLALIQARFRGVLWRKELAWLHRNGLIIQTCFRRFSAKLKADKERRRKLLGPEVVEMLRKGLQLNGLRITLVITRCGDNYRLIGNDLLNDVVYEGHVYRSETIQMLNKYNAQFPGETLHDKQQRIQLWHYARVAELMSTQIGMTTYIKAATNDMGNNTKKSTTNKVLVLMKNPIGPGIQQSQSLGRILQDQAGVIDRYNRLVTNRENLRAGNVKKTAAIRMYNKDKSATPSMFK